MIRSEMYYYRKQVTYYYYSKPDHYSLPVPFPSPSPAIRECAILLFTPSTHLPSLPNSVSPSLSCCCCGCGSITLGFCWYPVRGFGWYGTPVSAGSDGTAPGRAGGGCRASGGGSMAVGAVGVGWGVGWGGPVGVLTVAVGVGTWEVEVI